jgi:hypothetical protein
LGSYFSAVKVTVKSHKCGTFPFLAVLKPLTRRPNLVYTQHILVVVNVLMGDFSFRYLFHNYFHQKHLIFLTGKLVLQHLG